MKNPIFPDVHEVGTVKTAPSQVPVSPGPSSPSDVYFLGRSSINQWGGW